MLQVHCSGRVQPVSLFSLLRGSYDVQKGVLHHISAFDVAKLDASFNGLLLGPDGPVGSSRRRRYLNPIRDLFWDSSELEDLCREGLKLLLIGADAQALEQRLQDTKLYLKTHSVKRKLRIYLIGAFSLKNKQRFVLDRMIKFTIAGAPCAHRTISDGWQLRRLRQSMLLTPDRERNFIMAFGAPIYLCADRKQKGFWHRVQDLPDSTIDLRVYVPNYSDRVRERISFPLQSIPRALGLGMDCSRIQVAFSSFLNLCIGNRLPVVAQLKATGIRVIDASEQENFIVDLTTALPRVRLVFHLESAVR